MENQKEVVYSCTYLTKSTGHSSKLSDEQFENGNSNSSLVDGNNARETNLALLPTNDASIQHGGPAAPLQGEYANGKDIQNASSHLESSTVKHIKSTFVKISTVSQIEYQGRILGNGWNSYLDTSVFIMEESSSTHGLDGGSSSQTDDIVMSRYSTYDFENMELPIT